MFLIPACAIYYLVPENTLVKYSVNPWIKLQPLIPHPPILVPCREVSNRFGLFGASSDFFRTSFCCSLGSSGGAGVLGVSGIGVAGLLGSAGFSASAGFSWLAGLAVSIGLSTSAGLGASSLSWDVADDNCLGLGDDDLMSDLASGSLTLSCRD